MNGLLTQAARFLHALAYSYGFITFSLASSDRRNQMSHRGRYNGQD